MKKILGAIAVFSSAVLYSMALGAINEWYWLVIPSLIILSVVFLRIRESRFVLWGVIVWITIVVFSHYIWFFYLLRYRLSSSMAYSVVLYCALSLIHCVGFYIYFSLASLAWHCIKRYLKNRYLVALILMIGLSLSFQIAGCALMNMLDAGGGYNLLSPMIPLSRCFVGHSKKLKANEASNSVGQYSRTSRKNKVYLKIYNTRHSPHNLWGVGQYLFHALQALPAGPAIVMTPESFISCPLNREREFLSFVRRGLKPQQCLMLAAQYESADGRVFQAVYSITNQGIIHLYLKQHAVPCIEKMPWYLNTSKKLRKIFKAEQTFSYALQKKGEEGFSFEGMRIIPRLCSDFFLVTSPSDLAKLRLSYGENLVVVLHVNDTWFVTYMRELLYYVARMRAGLAGVDLVYVGYDGEVCKRI